MYRRALVVVFPIVAFSLGCGPKSAGFEYLPPDDRVYALDRQQVIDLVSETLSELGSVPASIQEAEEFTVVTSSAITRQKPDGPLTYKCRTLWLGVARGGWVEEEGRLTVSVHITRTPDGVSVRIRETGTTGCVPTGEVGRRILRALDDGVTSGRT